MCSTPAVQGLVCMMILEYGYDQWLCELFLFELRMSLSGDFARGGRTEERKRVPRGMALPASCDSGAFGRSVWSVVTSCWCWCFAYA